MDERSQGIILRTRPLTETSLIVHWLTTDHGRISTVAKGARRPKSPFRGKLDLFFEAAFSFSRSRVSDLHNLREVELQTPNETLRREMNWVLQASYCATLLENCTETESPIPEIHDLFQSFLRHLPERPPCATPVLAFELKLLYELGLGPSPEDKALSAELRQWIMALTEWEWQAIARQEIPLATVRPLERFLHGFLIHHVGRIPVRRHEAIIGMK